jgi:hypothetical protein
MRKLFTKRFFEASSIDQQMIVDSVLRDLEQATPYDDTGRAKRMIRRVLKKAVEYGIYTEGESK